MTGIRVNELLLAGVAGTDRTYGTSFRSVAGGGFRPLSVIAGQSQTGKSSIVDFIRYCLGDSSHPQNDEVRAAVRAALLETLLAGETVVLERSATGEPSKVALAFDSGLASISTSSHRRLPVDPPSDPESLSQFVLSACNLDGVLLPDSASKDETATQLLSIRDVLNVIFVPNERLDNKSLVFELGHHMYRQKFRQTVDAIFDVHDTEGALLKDRYRDVRERSNRALAKANNLRMFAEEEHPRGPLVLERDLRDSQVRLEELQTSLRALDLAQRTSTRALDALRGRLTETEDAARNARIRIRDRRSLIARLDALRGQYADDQRKLNFLLEAERLFDPLRVVTCPACFSGLDPSPTVEDGLCSLCGHLVPEPAEAHISEAGEKPALQDSGPDASGNGSTGERLSDTHNQEAALSDAAGTVQSELRNITFRLKSLNEYVARLRLHLRVLEEEGQRANEAADAAAQAVDAIAFSPAPWLAERDSLTQQITAAEIASEVSRSGVRVWDRVAEAVAAHERLNARAQAILAEVRTKRIRPDRSRVIGALSARFGEILAEIGYPKLANPFIADDLVPHVRNHPYTEASSGGMVVISLAWSLALWEVAFETSANAPGLLVIDSPQKNLGSNSEPGDRDFGDAQLVENFYGHARRWLSGDGTGAQLIVVDNTPPASIEDDVVIRFTRDPEVAPYGLIPEATS